MMVTEQTRRPLIALRDVNFVGEDKQIASLLKEMEAIDNSFNVEKALSDMIPVSRFKDHGRRAAANENWRRAGAKYNNDPDDFTFKVVSLMKQVIYLTQQRLKDMDPAVKRYEGDLIMRLAFVMCTLDEWIEQMHSMYTMLIKTTKPTYPNVSRELLYYQHFTKKNIDITYTVENMIELYAEMITRYGLGNAGSV